MIHKALYLILIFSTTAIASSNPNYEQCKVAFKEYCNENISGDGLIKQCHDSIPKNCTNMTPCLELKDYANEKDWLKRKIKFHDCMYEHVKGTF